MKASKPQLNSCPPLEFTPGSWRRPLWALIPFLLLPMHAAPMEWESLPPVPDAEGFAAPFAGVSGGALIVAGGANIPGDKWKEPIQKVWHDDVFILPSPEGSWQKGGNLPRACGYGVSVTADDAVLCLGGSDASQHFAACFRLQWTGDRLTSAPLPSLPLPCANACGALVGHTIYVAGGLETPNATTALHTFWSLDLDQPGLGWQELEPWPGPERMLSVAAEHDGSFYLFSGAKLRPGPDGKSIREYLRDAWLFTPGKGWERLPDMPRPAVAAASPAPWLGSAFAIFSGDDGTRVNFQPVRDHPGFPKTTLLYDPATAIWTEVGDLPFSRATVPTVIWKDRIILPNGETRPRVRTSEVWAAGAK